MRRSPNLDNDLGEITRTYRDFARQEQADRLTLEMTLNDIEQGGKLLAKSIYEMGRPQSADRFAELMQEAIRIADEALF